MPLKNSRRKPEASWYIPTLALSALLLLLHCKEAAREIPKDSFALSGFFKDLKQYDSTSEMLLFDSGARANSSNEFLLKPHYPPHLAGLAGITWLKETENTRNAQGDYNVDFRTEYWLENDRVIKLIRTDTNGNHIKTIQYDVNGLPVKVVTYYPDGKDSVTETYSFNGEKKLEKIVTVDGKTAKSLTRNFKYDSTGNLIGMLAEDSDGNSFNDKYYVDTKNISALTIRLDNNQQVIFAANSIHDSLGVPAYEEQYVKMASLITQTKKLFQYAPNGDLEIMKVIRPRRDSTTFAFTYPQRDAAGRWTKKWTFKGADVIGITEREMK